MQESLGIIPELTRLYTFNTPIRKGKYRLALTSLKFSSSIPNKIIARTSDGRKLIVDPKLISHQLIYFLGEYEPAITKVIESIVNKGDCCLDIGANIGYFTLMLAKLVGPTGKVFAFEPDPRNISLLSDEK